MNTTKKLLALLLACALAFCAAVPAFADDDSTAPVITRQPPKRIAMQTGQTVTLEVQAKLPEGATGELRYQWYVAPYSITDPNNASYTPLAGANGSKLDIRFSAEDVSASPNRIGMNRYYAVNVFAVAQDEDGMEIILGTAGYALDVICYPTFSDYYQVALLNLDGRDAIFRNPVGKVLFYVGFFPAAVFSSIAPWFLNSLAKLVK